MRESFVFYRSFFEAINELAEEDRLSMFMAIGDYALNEKEPQLKGPSKGLFYLMRPQIKANNVRFENGKAGAKSGYLGGRPRKNKQDDEENKTPNKPLDDESETPTKPLNANNETPKTNNYNPNKTPNVNVNVNVNDNVYVNSETRTHTFLDILESVGLVGLVKEQLALWLEYKNQRKECQFSEAEFRALCKAVADGARDYGDAAMYELIGICMSRGWKNIVFEKLSELAAKRSPSDTSVEDKKTKERQEKNSKANDEILKTQRYLSNPQFVEVERETRALMFELAKAEQEGQGAKIIQDLANRLKRAEEQKQIITNQIEQEVLAN